MWNALYHYGIKSCCECTVVLLDILVGCCDTFNVRAVLTLRVAEVVNLVALINVVERERNLGVKVELFGCCTGNSVLCIELVKNSCDVINCENANAFLVFIKRHVCCCCIERH